MKHLDVSVYLVTDSVESPHFFETIESALRGGVRVVQLRDKTASESALLRTALRLKAMLDSYPALFIINDHVSLAHKIGAGGVHLGQTDAPVREARKSLGHSAVIGLSIESHTPLHSISWENIDYAAASPVFASPSKKDTQPPFGLEKLSWLKRRCPVPLVAIGGITLANAPSVLAAGADGIAGVRLFSRSPNPDGVARKLMDLTQQAKGQR
jgi:thiamine-phosphate pyrophosphorylase